MSRLLICIVLLLHLSTRIASGQETDSAASIKLNRVIIIGNKKTLDRIILRELTLKTGDSIEHYRLEGILTKDKNKIYNLRLFHSVSTRVLELPRHSFDLLIEVEERWFIFPSPIFELSDRNFNEWWQNYDHKFNRINYGLRLYQYNFRGRNETIRLTAQFGFSRKFDLMYRIPYINKKQKQGLTFELSYSEPKNLAYKTEDHKLIFLNDRATLRKKFAADITYTYRKSFYETHFASLDFEHGTIADTIQHLNTNYYQEQNRQWFTSISYNFVSEHRDVIVYPLKGYQVAAGIKKNGLGLGEPVNQFVITANVALHKDLGRHFYLSNYTAGSWSTPVTQPYALYLAQGYRRNFVRGYEIYVIEGPIWGLNKTTLKRRIFNRTYRLNALPVEKFQHFPLSIYLKAYADFGYVKNYPQYEELPKQNILFSNKLIAGAGLGLDFVTAYDGILRVEYTLNKQGMRGFFLHLKKEF
jgi:outer membrane protein assembly factor BamA